MIPHDSNRLNEFLDGIEAGIKAWRHLLTQDATKPIDEAAQNAVEYALPYGASPHELDGFVAGLAMVAESWSRARRRENG